MFKAPSALMFQGSFDEAKAKAVEESKWLVSEQSYLASQSSDCTCTLCMHIQTSVTSIGHAQ